MNINEALTILERNGVKVYPTYYGKECFIEYELLGNVKKFPKVVTRLSNSEKAKKIINEAHIKTIMYLAEKIIKNNY